VRARRTHFTDTVIRLPGGTEDNDLWVYRLPVGGNLTTCSVWVPNEVERKLIAAGENIRLIIWAQKIPPVALDLTNEPIGKHP
jgi:hypothetical protein